MMIHNSYIHQMIRFMSKQGVSCQQRHFTLVSNVYIKLFYDNACDAQCFWKDESQKDTRLHPMFVFEQDDNQAPINAACVGYRFWQEGWKACCRYAIHRMFASPSPRAHASYSSDNVSSLFSQPRRHILFVLYV